jgi:LDH2 family malate/lactate/ureidoglycolate dehydrogenase
MKPPRRFPADVVEARVLAALEEAGASADSARAATRAMMHASLHGIDSHGARLAPHYCRMMRTGRINPSPDVTVERRAAASAIVDADDGLGHLGAYRAVELGCALAAAAGIAAVGVVNSSHFGAAGAYALAGAAAGFVAFATTNSNPAVTLHDGAAAFHGTNPLAFAAPVPGMRPWLFDMATSSIAMNRVLLARTVGGTLPGGVAAAAEGRPTTDPHAVEMLIPLGGTEYGFKGAGLAGVATLFSAILLGTTLDHEMIGMYDPDNVATPRKLGHFVVVIDPEKFAGRALFDAQMQRYVEAIRSAPRRPDGGKVMAPGDREWAEADFRRREGIPLDPDTARFLALG